MEKYNLDFDKETHTYSLDGRVLTPVTDLLKDCGIIQTTFYTGKGAENGSRRHLATELLDKDILDWSTIAECDMPYLSAWIQAKEELGIEITSIEEQMYHPLLNYAGTIDRRAIIKDEIYIIDIKTGAKAKWHELQLILYGLMVEPRPNLLAVYLKKNGKYAVEKYDYKNERFAMSAIRVEQWKNR